MSALLTFLAGIEKQMQQHLPDNRLLEKEVLSDFIFMAGCQPYPLMLQDMDRHHPVYLSPLFYTQLGHAAESELPAFELCLQRSGYLRRFGEYCDHFRSGPAHEDFSITLPLFNSKGELEHLLMFSRCLRYFKRSGNIVLSVIAPAGTEQSVKNEAQEDWSHLTKEDKLFLLGFQSLTSDNQEIVKCLSNGGTHEDAGEIILRSKHCIKTRKRDILKTLHVASAHEMKHRYHTCMRFTNRA